MSKRKIDSGISYFYVFILVIGGIGFSLAGYFILKSAFDNAYPQLFGIILGVFFLAFGLLSISCLHFMNRYIIENDKVSIHSVLGYKKSEIFIHHIVSYTEVKKESKNQKWLELTIFLKSGKKYKISSTLVDDYKQIKNRLTAGRRRDFKRELQRRKRINKVYGCVFLLLSVLFFIPIVKSYQNKDDQLATIDYQQVKGMLSEIKFNFGSKNQSVEFKLKEYPKFRFDISGSAYRALDRYKFKEKAKINTPIAIKIQLGDYEKKLLQLKDLSFWNKTINYSRINVYAVDYKGVNYLSLLDVEQEKQGGLLAYVIGFAFIGMLFIYGLYELFKKVK